MRKTHLPFPALALALLHFAPVFGQVELRLSLLPGAATYLVTARPQVTWLPPLDDLTHSAQVTLVVPSGSFSLENLQSHAGNWALTHLVERPSENPGADYAVFELLEETQAIPWQQGQEIPLFSFQNSGDCLGAFELLQNDDVYSAPNPMNMPLGNSFVVEGAGGEAYYGNYDTGSANCLTAFNCLIFSQLKILPDGFYELSLETPGGMDSVASLQLALKVPTGLFQLHDLGNLQSGLLAFGATARYNAPPEAPGFDYFVFRLDAVSASGFTLAAGATPILRFANGGSCQGDSIFLLDNAHESFLPPNTQIADIAQKIRLLGGATFGLCAGEADAAPCSGCQFTPEVLHLDSVLAMPAAACLGYQNGMLKIFAQGANALEFSLDGGQIWSGNPVFTSLAAGIYQPIVRGTHFGCPVFAEGDPIEVAAGTEMNVLLDLPPKACAGDDIPLHILAPAQFPAGTAFSWTGPGGFASTIYDPVIFDVNNFQSGIYAVDVKVPGCETASDFATLQVAELPAEPVVLTNSPLCDGDTLRLQTAALPIAPTGVGGTQFEWISPAGISAWSSPDSLAFFPKNHPAYLSGEWRLRLSDANGCQAESAPVAVSIKNRPQAFAENTGPVCSGAAVQLLGNPMPGASYQWRKPGESVIFSMQPDPVVPNLTSLQTYSLTVSQDGCASENLSLTTVSLHPKTTILPESDYTVAADCSPEGLEFSANATGVGLNFKWTGVNGFLSHLENPEIADAGASQNGSYLLEATNLFGCVVSQPLLVSGVVDALPMPLVQGSPPVCPGETMQLETQAYDNFSVSYQWYKNNIAVGGGSASQLFLPNVQPANEGAYRVKVTVDDCVLNSANYNLDLLDLPAATPDFFLSNPCEGGVLQFFSNMDGIAAWHWTGPDGFVSEAPNPLIYNVEFDNVGAYALYVTGSNGCTAAANVVVDGILEVPEMPAVISNSPVCAEDQIVLTVQNPPIDGTVFFEWFNADGVLIAGGIGTAESTLVLGTADSLAKPPFVVKTVRNGCPSMLSDPVPVEVKPMPVAVAGYTEPVCPGSPVQLFAAPVPGGNYEWRAGGQAVAFGQNPTLILSDTTTYELVVKIEDCDAEASTTTTVPTLPTPQIAAVSGNGSYCEGTTLTLNAENSTPLDGQVQYVWTGPGGFSYAGSDEPDGDFSLTLNLLDEPNEGTYTLTLTSETGCVSTPQSAAINVAAMPLPPTLTAAENTLCQGETLQLDVTPVAGSNVDYQWYFHDGSNDTLLGSTSFPTYFLPSVTASNSGTYFAIVEVEGCGSTPSNLVPVEVTGATTNLLATNSTLAQAACSGGQVDLFVPFVPGANYVWYGPAGFSSELPNPLIVNAQANQSGSYLVVVELPGCLTTLTSSTEVLIGETPALPRSRRRTRRLRRGRRDPAHCQRPTRRHLRLFFGAKPAGIGGGGIAHFGKCRSRNDGQLRRTRKRKRLFFSGF